MSNSRLSYQSEYELMDKAMKEGKGVRTHIGTREAAMTYRLRLNRARALDRKLNALAYPAGHKMHGGSEYDELVFTVREDTEGECWVYLEKALAPTHVEALE
jgi:hypothetical protein